jgi:hypothetical protein
MPTPNLQEEVLYCGVLRDGTPVSLKRLEPVLGPISLGYQGDDILVSTIRTGLYSNILPKMWSRALLASSICGPYADIRMSYRCLESPFMAIKSCWCYR